MPELLAEELVVNDAASTYERSVALEELWTPPPAGALLSPVLEQQLVPELLDFLQQRQDGTRAVARSMIDRVLRARAGAFSPAPTSAATLRIGNHDRLGPVFGEVPDDTGHWDLPYFQHTLGPLQQTPPGYVLEVTTGDFDENRLAAELPDHVAGIVVVRVPPRV